MKIIKESPSRRFFDRIGNMKEIIPKDSRYIPIVQQKSCCVPASILMIMYRHRIPLISQELIGYHLGLIVASENRKLFWNVRTGKRPSSGYGTQIYKKEFNPNVAFSKLKIPLRMIFHPISKFSDKDFKNFVVEVLKKDKDMLTCFDHGKLSGNNVRGGHVCVIDRVNIKDNTIRLIDPQNTQPKWRVVKISRLLEAMQFHGDKKSGGLWEFETTNL